jgi:hypothetical protein
MGTRAARLKLLPITGVAALYCLVSTWSQAAAQSAVQWTPEERAACESDAMRLCGEFREIDQIKTCMQRKRAQVSARCRVVMTRRR